MATTTALGDAGDEPELTPEQREALRRAFSSPIQMQRFQLAESTFSSLNKTITSSAISAIAPALERWREQQTEMTKAIASTISAQVRMESVIAPILEQTRRMQAEMARNLQVSILANEQFRTSISHLVISSEFTEAMRRVRDLSTVKFELPTEDGFDRLAGMVERGEIDEDTTAFAEQAISQNAELSAAIDVAVDEFVKRRPLIPRWVVRRMIVTWVWLMYGGFLYVVAVMTSPEVAAIPGSFGLPVPNAVAKKAGEKFDQHYPPVQGDTDEPEKTEK